MPPQPEIQIQHQIVPPEAEQKKPPRQRATKARQSRQSAASATAQRDANAIAREDHADVPPAFENETPGEREPSAVTVTIGETGQQDKPPKEAKSGIPSLDEWQDFIGRIVLRTITDAYVTLMLRDIELTDREERQIHLSKDDLKDMAAPFASVANKSKIARKHGRMIISLTDSYEAIIALMIWARRVNRIAKKHRKTEPVQGAVINPATAANGANGNGRSNRQDEKQGPGEGPGFRVFNPGSG